MLKIPRHRLWKSHSIPRLSARGLIHHLQGLCVDGLGNIFWSFTTELVKTNFAGKVLVKIPVGNHHGDLCYHEGKVFVAVNFGDFNNPEGKADSWVYVYDAAKLLLIAKHQTPEVTFGAGGIACHAGKYIVVGGLPEIIFMSMIPVLNSSRSIF